MIQIAANLLESSSGSILFAKMKYDKCLEVNVPVSESLSSPSWS